MIQAQGVQSGMRQVDVDNIERELDNMWRQNNASALASGSHPATRNSVLTLVVFTYGEQAALATRNAVNAMVGMHPSRSVIVVPLNSHDGPPLESYIDTGLYSSTAGASYGEQIVVFARDDAVPHLSGVVLPLIISGLPYFLWWRNDPPWRSEQLEAMVDGCDRFIVDTSEMQQGLPGLVALDDLQRRKKSASATSDFNWSRQGPWRELTAGFFDAPALRPYLGGIDRVTIEYAAGAEDKPHQPGLGLPLCRMARLTPRLAAPHRSPQPRGRLGTGAYALQFGRSADHHRDQRALRRTAEELAGFDLRGRPNSQPGHSNRTGRACTSLCKCEGAALRWPRSVNVRPPACAPRCCQNRHLRHRP